MAAHRIWIKNPLALFTANDQKAPGGLVIEDGVITELLAAGATPALSMKSPSITRPTPAAIWPFFRK